MREALKLRVFTHARPVALRSAGRLVRTFARAFARALVYALALLVGAPVAGIAHEIPKSVLILAYLKPSGDTLRVVARVPMEAMRDIQWPLRGPGYLELARLDSLLKDGTKIWLVDNLKVYEAGTRLEPPRIRSAIVSLQSDRSFESYETAFAHATGPSLGGKIDLAYQQAMVDVVLEYPIKSAESRFSMNAEFGRLGVRTTTVLHLLPPGHAQRDFTWMGDPGLVHLDPQWFQSAGLFVRLGFSHILDGIDHLLFLLCLVIPFRRIRPLVGVVTAFTIAHSITLIASAMGLVPGALWFPPLIEVLIALSIVWMAFENILGVRLDKRWMLAFGFGLIHGFGFSFALRESLQLAGSHLLTSLVSFNVGVELGQLAMLIVAVPVLNWVVERVTQERIALIILSALVAHTAWHWLIDRWIAFRAYPVALPPFDAVFGAGVLRVLTLGAIALAGAWVARGLVSRLSPATGVSASAPESHNS